MLNYIPHFEQMQANSLLKLAQIQITAQQIQPKLLNLFGGEFASFQCFAAPSAHCTRLCGMIP